MYMLEVVKLMTEFVAKLERVAYIHYIGNGKAQKHSTV